MAVTAAVISASVGVSKYLRRKRMQFGWKCGEAVQGRNGGACRRKTKSKGSDEVVRTMRTSCENHEAKCEVCNQHCNCAGEDIDDTEGDCSGQVWRH